MYLVAGTYDMNESVAYFPAATTPAPLITAGSKWPSPPVLRGVGFNSTVIRRAITAGSTTGGVEPVPKQKKTSCCSLPADAERRWRSPAARRPPPQRGGGGPPAARCPPPQRGGADPPATPSPSPPHEPSCSGLCSPPPPWARSAPPPDPAPCRRRVLAASLPAGEERGGEVRGSREEGRGGAPHRISPPQGKGAEREGEGSAEAPRWERRPGDHGQIQWRAAKSGQVGAASGRAAADEG